MQIGSYAPWMQIPTKKTIRAPINPLDKATLVSIYPKDIDEIKQTIQPGDFHLPAGSYDKPSILVIGPSSWWREVDENQPLLEIPQSSIQVADSIVRDYSNGRLGCDMDQCMPGLFFLPGSVTIEQLKSIQYKPKLDDVAKKQRNWYSILVKLADSLWARTNGNPLAIGDDMRLAAHELGLKDKLWLRDFQPVELVPCPACGTLRQTTFPVCAVCHTVIDKNKYAELGLSKEMKNDNTQAKAQG